MATAAELLAASVSGASVDKTLVIDNYLRTIYIPPSITSLGVENDDEVLRLKFRMPRYIGAIDLSTFSVRINYLNAKGEGDVYTVTDTVVANGDITFSWLVGPMATRYKGNTKFNVCMRIVDSEFYVQKEYNTTIATLPVLEGLECEESAIEYYSDILEQWKAMLFGIGDTEEAKLLAKSEEAQQNIVNKGAEVLATIPEDYTTTHKLALEGARTKGDAITCVAEDEIIELADSSDDYICGLNVYGKTTQPVTTGKQLFDHTNIGSNYYTTIEDDGTIIIDCDNSTGETDKWPTFYTPVSPLLKESTTYAVVLEVLSSSGLGEKVYVTSWVSDEIAQFKDTISITNPTVGKHVKLAKTRDTFDDVKYMCRGFMTVPPRTKVKSVIRVSVVEDTTITADNFVYETYSDGIPSPRPSWPQKLEPIEQPLVNVYGKNLITLSGEDKTHNGVTYKMNNDGTITASGTATDLAYVDYTASLAKGLYHFSGCPRGGDTVNGYFIRLLANGSTVYDDAGLGFDFELLVDSTMIVRLVARAGTVLNDMVFSPMICLADTVDKTYTTGRDPQELVTPYNLHGVPTNQNGNYTDATGQQWVCDEIDFERGVFIQRVKELMLDGTNVAPYHGSHSNGQTYCALYPDDVATGSRLFSTAYVNPTSNWSNEHGHIYCINKCIVITDSRFTSAGEAAAILADEQPTIMYALETPIETEIPADTMSAFLKLHTYRRDTVVRNDHGAMMKVKYNVDTMTFIDEAIRKYQSTPSEEDIQAAVDKWLTEHLTSAEGVHF